MKVINKFRDKHTKKVYEPGTTYENNDTDRINELVEKGYLEPNDKTRSVLDGNVDEVKGNLDILSKSGTTQDELNNLLMQEQDGLNRKGVTEYIKQLI